MELTGIIEGRYAIISRLGAGAFGEVYRALDRRLNREVAIKRLLLETMSEGDERRKAQARFLQEARIAARLQHPNIVTVHDVVGTSEILFMVLELVEGETLQDRIYRYTSLDPFETLAILGPAAEAIDFANRDGVVHRDVKPANIMIDHKGTVKVADFGIAKIDNTSNLTGTGHLIGTPNYMSPEQARGEVVDHRSDIFSLGCVLFECMSGRKAFDGESVTAVLLKIVGNQPERFEAAGLGMHTELMSVIDRALAHNKDDRFPTASAMMVALESATATTTHKSAAQVLEATIAAGKMLGLDPTFASSTLVDTASQGVISVQGPPPPPQAPTSAEPSQPLLPTRPVGPPPKRRSGSAETTYPPPAPPVTRQTAPTWQRYWPLAIAACIVLIGVSGASLWLGRTLATDQKARTDEANTPTSDGAYVVVGDPNDDRSAWEEQPAGEPEPENPTELSEMESIEIRRPEPTPRPQLTPPPTSAPLANDRPVSSSATPKRAPTDPAAMTQSTPGESESNHAAPPPSQQVVAPAPQAIAEPAAPAGPGARPGPGQEYEETLRVRVGVELDVEPNETVIAINGKVVGTAKNIEEDWEFTHPGTYSFRFTAPGRNTQWWLVEVGTRGDKWEDLEVDLKRIKRRKLRERFGRNG